MKKITLEDIAKSLGVSKTLVSLILNNKAKEHGISPDTVDRVLKKVKEMNYMPNQAARGLRTGKTNLIGLIVADISNPFYARISRAIEDLAWKKDYHLMVCSSDEDPEKEAQLVRILREKMQVEGLIISPTTDNVEVFRDLKRMEFPFVLIDRNYPKFSCNSVVVDNIRSSQSAVKHLIDSGAKRVALLTLSPAHISTLSERQEGYKLALKEAGIPFEDDLVREVPFSDIKSSVKKTLQDWLKAKQPIDAVFCANNHLAVAVLETISDLGLRIPYDLRMVSFDDVDVFKFSYPPVSAVAQPIEDIGTRAMEILFNNINDRTSRESVEHVVLPAELVIRRSSSSL
ncbi:MAG: LacI family DNA-binding transcriptional regulator [Flavobacteriales bacterium]